MSLKSQFLLNPEITFLNHGSFGACPKPILENYQYWQRELEWEPVQFIQKKAPQYLQLAKEAMAKYIGCSADDFFFTANPTIAINTIMRSMDLKRGDEILATNHEYGAMDRTWNFYCEKSGVKYVRQNISIPIQSKESLLEEFWSGYTSKTKIVFLNQISSATALIFPVKEIIQKARSLGLITIIDGAHVPGHIDLNLAELNPDFYTGTLHKWMLAPKGCSFLYVKSERQKGIDPLIVGWGYQSETPSNSPFLDYHQHQGTRDISAFLTAPAVIQFLTNHNWKAISAISKQLILENYQRFCTLLGTQPICPMSSEFLGQMCSIPINTSNPIGLKEILYSKNRIEIPIMKSDHGDFIRISLNAYNNPDDLDTLFDALSAIKRDNDLLK